MLGRAEALTRGRLLAGNVALNLAGWLLPAGVAVLAYPALLRGMGAERFGLLALAWAGVGYFSVFDLGVGRALTQALAESAARGDERESPALTWTSLWLLAPVSAVAALLLALAAPALADRVLGVPGALRDETVRAVRLLAVGVPAMVLTSALRGVLEAGQHFRLINALKVPLAVATFAGPMAVQLVSPGLPAAVGVLVAARVVVAGLHAWAVVRVYPGLRAVRGPRRADVGRLWRSAGWLTVSSVVSPVLVSVDRLVVGALLPAAALAHYATATEVATKLWLFPAALQPVLFAALATSAAYDSARAAALFDRAARATFVVLVPAAVLVVLFAREVLAVWLGAEVAAAAAPALRLLTVAVLVNSVAQVPYALVQGIGRADLAGKLHVLELPLYAALLWELTRRFGLPGAAAAWLTRMAVDGAALLALTGRVLPQARHAAARAGVATAVGAAAIALGALPAGLGARAAAATLLLGALALAARRGLITPAEWAAVGGAARAVRGRLRAPTGRRRAVPPLGPPANPDRAGAGD